jgi:hypothetical protein
MKYYKLINESLHKLIEEQSSDSLNIEVMDRKGVLKEFIDYVASLLKKDWKDVIVIDNVIYVIEEDFENTIDSGETVNVKNGIFSIYQFTGGEVIDYRVNLNTISDINQIGKKPLSYFTHGWNNDLHDLDDFFSNYDRYFGRNTFISEGFDDYLSNLKNSLGLEENMLNEENEQEDNLKVMSKEDLITSFEESGENPFEIMGVDIFTKYPYLIPSDNFNKMYDVLGSWGGLKKIPEAVKYIKEFFISEFNRVNRNASRFKMSFFNIRTSISSNLDDNFVRGLFEKTGVYEFFSYDSKDIDFSSYDVDKINEKNIKKLSEIGFSEEDLKKIASGEGLDEEHPLVRWNDYLLSIIKRALSEGTAVGTEQDAFEHFNDLFISSLPEGVTYDSTKDDGDYKYLEVYPSFFEDKDNLGVLWENIYDNNDDVDNAIKNSVIEIFNDNFYMSDSDNYDGFSEEAFNDRLEEELVEFEEDLKKPK